MLLKSSISGMKGAMKHTAIGASEGLMAALEDEQGSDVEDEGRFIG